MRLHRTLTPIVFTLCLLVWPALVQAGYLAGVEAWTLGDYATALKEWRPLAELGDMESQFRMGFLYDNGYGVPQDDGAAARWYRLAAEQGHDLAQRRLGLLYEQGRGVLQDYVQAHMWFNLAAAQGHKNAVNNKEVLAEKMTPEQIAAAQWLAREWLAQHQK